MSRTYNGKYPHRLRMVSTARRPGGQQTVFLESNAGERIECDGWLIAASSGMRIPKLGEDIRDYYFAKVPA